MNEHDAVKSNGTERSEVTFFKYAGSTDASVNSMKVEGNAAWSRCHSLTGELYDKTIP